MKFKYVCLLTAYNYISHSYCTVRAFKCFFAYLVNLIRNTDLQIMLRSKTRLSTLYEYLLAIQFHDTQQHYMSHSEHLATQQTKFLQFWAYWRLDCTELSVTHIICWIFTWIVSHEARTLPIEFFPLSYKTFWAWTTVRSGLELRYLIFRPKCMQLQIWGQLSVRRLWTWEVMLTWRWEKILKLGAEFISIPNFSN